MAYLLRSVKPTVECVWDSRKIFPESDGGTELRHRGGILDPTSVAGSFRRPRCGSGTEWPVRDLWECAGGGSQTSATAGTILQDTRTPLPLWFRAMGVADCIRILRDWSYSQIIWSSSG